MQLDIRVHPRASHNAIEVDGERVIVRITASPEFGKANDAVIALLAKRLRVPKSGVRIVRGVKSRDKRVRIDGLSTVDALKILRTERG